MVALVEESGAEFRPRRSDEELVRLHVSYALTRDKRLRAELSAEYAPFADALAGEFGAGAGTRKASRASLMRAIDRYDDGRHGKFKDWAAARIRDDLRRRGRPGAAVPPGLLEDHTQVVRTLEDLSQELGRSPTVAELAARSGLTEERVLTAMELLSDDE